MPTSFPQELFGVSPRDWLIAFGLALAVVLVLWRLRDWLAHRLRGAAATPRWSDDLAELLVKRTSRLALVAVGALVVAWRVGDARTLPTWLRIVEALVWCWQLLRWGLAAIDFWLERLAVTRGQDRTALGIVSVVLRGVFGVLVVLLLLDNLGVNVTALVTGLGITGIAVALAVQNILGDFLAALAIAMDKPFEVGDRVQFGDFSGRVERLGLKTTRFRAESGEEVSFANAELLKQRIHNLSRMRATG
jgi:small-conductance mechanosensitive channel